jgi:DNA-binding winged helix-turn-helix (wHTH) protein
MPALTFDPRGFPLLDDRPLSLPPKERAALALLFRDAGVIVRKEDFAAEAWAGRPMSDESLARCISRLRRALAATAWRIEAVYGAGYRLLAADAPPPADAPDPAAADTLRHALQLADQRTPRAAALALDLLRGLQARWPAYADARVALGHALAAAIGWGQVPTGPAVEEGLRALGAAPGDHAVLRGGASARGLLLDMAWRFDEARESHRAALKAQPDDPQALLAAARHGLMTGEPDAAVVLLEHVARVAPHLPLLRTTLARALVQGGRGPEALACARAGVVERPGELFPVAFEMAIRAMVQPDASLAADATRLVDLPDPPPWVWTVLSFVLSRTQRREDALDVIDAALMCASTTAGEATLYVAPLVALGEHARAAALLDRAFDESCGMLAMVLRDPANAVLVAAGGAAAHLVPRVFARLPRGRFAAG